MTIFVKNTGQIWTKSGGGTWVSGIPALTITTPSSISVTGIVGIPYAYSMAASGGVKPYTWSLVSDVGSNNPWTVTSFGSLTCTPTTAEIDSAIVIKVQDSVGSTAQGTFSVTVSGAVGAVTQPGSPLIVGSGPTTLYMRWAQSAIGTGELLYQYRIYSSTSPGGPFTPLGVSPIAAYVASGLSNSTTYYFKVDCQDEALNTSSQSSISTYATGISGTLAAAAGPDYAQPPSSLINSRFVLPVGGTTWTVNKVGNTAGTGTNNATNCGLAYAVANCVPGDVIYVATTSTDANGWYDLNALSGNTLTLPNKSSAGPWIYIISADYASLPPPGTRIDPSYVAHMPRVLTTTSNTGNVGLGCAASASNYRFVGINFDATYANGVAQAASNRPISFREVPSAGGMAHDIVLDRCRHQAGAVKGGVHGIRVSCNSFSMLECYFDGWIDMVGGQDSQAVFVDTAVGPLKFRNCYLEGGSENLLSGGSVTAFPCVPGDVQVTDCYFFKPIATWGTLPNPAGVSVKNLFEIKNGQRWLIAHNRLENHWQGSQVYAVSFKTSTQSGVFNPADPTICKDVLFVYNRVINISGGPAVHACSTNNDANVTTRVTLRDNVWEVTGINGANVPGSSGTCDLFCNDAAITVGMCVDTIIEHNTGLYFSPTTRYTCYLGPGATPWVGPYNWLVHRNNLFKKGSDSYYIASTSSNNRDKSGLDVIAPSLYTVTNNAWVGTTPGGGAMPTGNFYPATYAAVQFVGTFTTTAPTNVSDYALQAGSAYHNAATDGFDIGAYIPGVAT